MPGDNTMWDHARLLRRVLLLSSMLTLSGLHEPHQQSAGWRAARLVPLTLCLGSVAASTAHSLLTADRSQLLTFSLLMLVSAYHTLLLLLHLLRHRRRLHGLLRHVAELETATALCRRPGDAATARRQTALLLGTCGLSLAVWSVGFFSRGQLAHPRYIIPWLVPEWLQQRQWYGVVIGAQVVISVLTMLIHLTFDLVLAGLADALAMLQARLVRYCREYLDDNRGRRECGALGHSSVVLGRSGDARGRGAGEVSDQAGDDTCFTVSGSAHQTGPWRNGPAPAPAPAGCTTLTLTPPGTSQPGGRPAAVHVFPSNPAARLEELSEVYGSLRRLAADTAALCSVPALSLHSTAAASLLLGGYLVTAMGLATRGTGLPRQLYSPALFLAALLLRLLAVSCAGSRLLERGQQLHQTLAAAGWSGQLPARRGSVCGCYWSEPVGRRPWTPGACSPCRRPPFSPSSASSSPTMSS